MGAAAEPEVKKKLIEAEQDKLRPTVKKALEEGMRETLLADAKKRELAPLMKQYIDTKKPKLIDIQKKALESNWKHEEMKKAVADAKKGVYPK